MDWTVEEVTSFCKLYKRIEGKHLMPHFPLFHLFEACQYDVPRFFEVMRKRSGWSDIFFEKDDQHIYRNFILATDLPFNDIPLFINNCKDLYKDILVCRLVLGK